MSKSKKASDAVAEYDLILLRNPSKAETSREIMRRTGFGEARVMRILHGLNEAGRLRKRKELRKRIDDVLQPVMVYWVDDKSA